jgi:hypothetical protein
MDLTSRSDPETPFFDEFSLCRVVLVDRPARGVLAEKVRQDARGRRGVETAALKLLQLPAQMQNIVCPKILMSKGLRPTISENVRLIRRITHFDKLAVTGTRVNFDVYAARTFNNSSSRESLIGPAFSARAAIITEGGFRRPLWSSSFR